MRSIISLIMLAGGCFFLSPAVLAAQAVTIIGNNSDAQLCSLAAHNAAKSQFISREDLATCDRALDFVGLKKRDRAGTHVNRGIIAAALSRYKEAFRDYQKAMEIKPDLPEAYVGRGNIYFMSGKLNKAIEDYTHALELGINRDHLAFLNRGLAHEKLKDYAAAEEDYQMALERAPEWSLAQRKLSLVRAKQTIGE